MKKNFFQIVLGFLAICLIGCAASPQQSMVGKTEFKAGATAPELRIAILSIPNPPFYWMGEGTGAGSVALGVWGSMAELSDVGSDSHLYGNFDFAELTEKRLKEQLAVEGYKTEVIDVTRPEGQEATLLKDYSTLNVDGIDAYLDIVPLAVGYKGENSFTMAIPDLGPHVTVVARLVSAETQEVMYSETISYGYQKLIGATWIDHASDKDYDNVDDLKANMSEATQELESAVLVVADTIANRLDRSTTTVTN